jgi:hypothetical protein
MAGFSTSAATLSKTVPALKTWFLLHGAPGSRDIEVSPQGLRAGRPAGQRPFRVRLASQAARREKSPGAQPPPAAARPVNAVFQSEVTQKIRPARKSIGVPRRARRNQGFFARLLLERVLR